MFDGHWHDARRENPPNPGFYLVSRLENRHATTRYWTGTEWMSHAIITHWMYSPYDPE